MGFSFGIREMFLLFHCFRLRDGKPGEEKTAKLAIIVFIDELDAAKNGAENLTQYKHNL